jgi:hypothetical protein
MPEKENQNLKNILERMKELKVNSSYEYYKHYHDSDKYRRNHSCFSLAATISSAISLVSLTILYPQEGWNQSLFIILAILGTVVATVFSGIITIYNYENKARNHFVSGGKFLSLCNRIKLVEAKQKDGLLEKNDLIKEIEEMTVIYSNYASQCPQTSKKSYKYAKKCFEEGNLEYTQGELENL